MENLMMNGFCEMTEEEMMLLDGGNWLKAGAAFLGVIAIGVAPVVGVGTTIAASTLTPVVGVASGVGAWAGLSSAGASLLDYACN